MGKPKSTPKNIKQNNSHTTMCIKQNKSMSKRIKLKKHSRIKVQKLRKVFDKLRQSYTELKDKRDASCIVLDDSRLSSESERDGDTVIFVEDRAGSTAMEDVSNVAPQKCHGTSPKRKLSNKPMSFSSSLCETKHSTPISKKSNKALNISNISAVEVSPQQRLSREISNLSQDIRNEYVTIDLTNGSEPSKSVIDLTSRKLYPRTSCNASVIDLEAEEGECSNSLTSDAEVTVINVEKTNKKVKEKQIAEGIALLNASEKDRLLTLITEKIFNGCNIVKKTPSASRTLSQEDSYIRDMLEGNIRASIGDNVYHPAAPPRHALRMVVIDGSNVAMHHGNSKVFSVKGIKICIDYFLKRGHTVKAFVPHFRCMAGKSSDPALLQYLAERGLVVFTPSRRLNSGRCISSYDDRYIVQCAAEFGGVIVSQDRYKDLAQENAKWAKTIEKRLLQFTWVQDMIMFPVDPLGRDGPTLDAFLRH